MADVIMLSITDVPGTSQITGYEAQIEVLSVLARRLPCR